MSTRQRGVFGVTSADPDDEREAHPIAYHKLGYSVRAITRPSTFGETADPHRRRLNHFSISCARPTLGDRPDCTAPESMTTEQTGSSVPPSSRRLHVSLTALSTSTIDV